jgi:hypothetical protein
MPRTAGHRIDTAFQDFLEAGLPDRGGGVVSDAGSGRGVRNYGVWPAAIKVLTAALVAAVPVPAAPPARAVPAAVLTGGCSPTPKPGSGCAPADPVKPTTVCRVTDKRLDELSGMVRTPTGFAVVDDGSDLSSHRRIFFLDNRCTVVRAVKYPSTPRDTEDLAQAPDGTLWVADIGDNNRNRETIALWRLASGAASPVLYRMTYPDGPHDAEALVLAGDGTPVVVTKDPETAELYQPAQALVAGKTTPLRHVGEFNLPGTGTSNPFSFLGRAVITGGANASDGSHVVLRTYADAFEFPVSHGDVVHAITTEKPRSVPLPDEPQGESIAYDHDGSSLLTVSEWSTDANPVILRYAGPVRSPSPSPGRSSGKPGGARSGPAQPGSTAGKVRPSTVGGLVAVTGLGVLAVLGFALYRRRRPRG